MQSRNQRNSGNQRNSAEIVASIDDLLTQILSKVPIKPLIRSKLVSKHWLSLISTHNFCPNSLQGFLLRFKNRDVRQYEYDFIPNSPDSYLPSINLDFADYPLSTEISHSCNGLLLCNGPNTFCNLERDPVDRKLYVYNPTTKLSTVLPSSPNWATCSSWAPGSARLVFDPVKSPHYKVLLVEKMRNCCVIRIYCSETRGWSYGCDIDMERWLGMDMWGVYCDGSVHWLNAEFSAKNPRNALRFHVETRRLVEMPSPPVVNDVDFWTSNVYFGESCDHLHFIECIPPRFNVYEMKRDYSEWFVKYKVDLSPFIAEYPEMIVKGFDNEDFYVINVLSLVRGKNDIESNLVLRIPNKAMKFNLVDGTWKKLCGFVHDRVGYRKIIHSNGFASEFCYDDEYGLDYIQSLSSV